MSLWLSIKYKLFKNIYKSSEEETTAVTVANALGDWWWSSILHSEKRSEVIKPFLYGSILEVESEIFCLKLFLLATRYHTAKQSIFFLRNNEKEMLIRTNNFAAF